MNTRIVRLFAAIGIMTVGYVVDKWYRRMNNVRKDIDKTIDDFVDYYDDHFDVCKDIDDSDDYYNSDPEYKSGDVTYLTASDLKQIRWMTASQIQNIFGNKHGKIKILSSEEAYKELRWMTNEQLKALFG